MSVSSLRCVPLVLLACLSSGCALPYYWQAVGGQIELLSSRQPLDEVLADPALDPAVRHALERVPAMLEFARTRLGLPSDGSYSTYVDLDRPYVVWNVVAAEEFSTEPVSWCFPFAGCVAYRGYFERDTALAFERRLVERGYDTYSAGATAYSTLGWFEDPVLSTMLAAGPDALAALLFHELAHRKLYIAGDSEFNEAFATALEEYGTLLWLAETAGSEAVEAFRARRTRRDRFTALVFEQQRRLAVIYASGAAPDAMRRDKREAFARMRADYAAFSRRWDTAGEYAAWIGQDLNNASLAAIATYRRWLPAFRARLDAVGLDAFLDETAAAADMAADEREALLEGWLTAASAAGRLPEPVDAARTAAEVARHDAGHRRRLDAERTQAVVGADAGDRH